MTEKQNHICSESPPWSGVIIENGDLKMVDEYKFNINYCPYCGRTEEEIKIGEGEA
jgi:hypothetical protein